jgi:hypothetical protein
MIETDLKEFKIAGERNFVKVGFSGESSMIRRKTKSKRKILYYDCPHSYECQGNSGVHLVFSLVHSN